MMKLSQLASQKNENSCLKVNNQIKNRNDDF
jgi:hypothetical protein